MCWIHKGGGIRLAEGAQDLRLGDIVKLLEPNMFMVECSDAETNTCRVTQTCNLKHYLFDASNEFINTLNQNTLGDTVT